jgi:hypothetical protein
MEMSKLEVQTPFSWRRLYIVISMPSRFRNHQADHAAL